MIGWSGGMAAGLVVPGLLHAQPQVVEVLMRGRGGGAAVWFDPIGVRVEPGVTVRWTNRDRSNVHTATTYHPSIGGRQGRIPEAAEPWDSGPLLPDEAFSIILGVPGVYDYFCAPHERAGMVGRIVVGEGHAEPAPAAAGEPPSPAALAAFPAVSRILSEGIIRAP